ncbi:unnamed protein product [Dovyalis caffra]|uniref:Uncharacterized protein n=1 Tax=Dovyalis caffra TaxID=77055 RepID=A0AAV1S3Q9_9ROSI|nr:unnamed protein product [Dovyalis caffra]
MDEDRPIARELRRIYWITEFWKACARGPKRKELPKSCKGYKEIITGLDTLTLFTRGAHWSVEDLVESILTLTLSSHGQNVEPD